jgi:glycosyltransferase involved in cell wall biosynthesis
VNEIAATAPPHWKFEWIGDGELRHALDEERIGVLGWLSREEVLSRLSQCDVLLHPSRWEGMPNAVLEAMALGLPVIASDIVGNRSLVRPGETGYLVNELKDYLAALHELANKPCLRKRLGQAGFRTVLENFDSSKLAERWEQIYRQVARLEALATAD